MKTSLPVWYGDQWYLQCCTVNLANVNSIGSHQFTWQQMSARNPIHQMSSFPEVNKPVTYTHSLSVFLVLCYIFSFSYLNGIRQLWRGFYV